MEVLRLLAAGIGIVIGSWAGAMQTSAAELGSLRVGVLKFGTVKWELDVIKANQLDAKHGFTLEITDYANDQATDVAIQGGAVDAIVTDWLWVSRQRSEGSDLTFIPYSSSVGALMVKADSGISDFKDLAGKTIGIAGGPLDKSWLLIQAYAARHHDINLTADVEAAFGAPPLLNEKIDDGELDAVLNYWHYCARLEAKGYRRLIDVNEASAALGVEGVAPQLGYTFHDSFAADHADLVKAFVEASQAAKKLLQGDEEWERIRELTNAEDDATFEALKERYREGIPKRWGEQERAAAAKLFAVLAELGGEELVGPAEQLAPGTFWSGISY